MSVTKPNIGFRVDSLSARNLRKLKWATTIAIFGFPVMVQIMGALMLFSKTNPNLLSVPVLWAYGAILSVVIVSGVYAITNRVFLRFTGANNGLLEWESKTQSDAFAFSYGVIAKGVVLAFVCVSVLGGVQLLNNFGWVNLSIGRSIELNVEGLAALCVILTYFILLLPTLYIAWTLSPLVEEDLELA